MAVPPNMLLSRLRAVNEAGVYLREHGFAAADTERPARKFRGREEDIAGRQIRLDVELPEAFPTELPRVGVEGLFREVPHVEGTGRICLTADVGLFLDASRPADVVRDALARARAVLTDGLKGTNAADFVHEYPAYWLGIRKLALRTPHILSAKSSPLGFRADMVSGFPSLEVSGVIEEGVGGSEVAQLYLRRPLKVPKSDKWTLADIGDLLLSECDAHERWRVVGALLRGAEVLLLSMPLFNGRRLLLGITTSRIRGHRARAGLRLLRRRPWPPGRWNRKLREVPVVRCNVLDLHRSTLIPRAGGALMLESVFVTIVGCGAVGGFAAAHLARLGVRHLVLVDDDEFAVENISRHVLGAKHVGRPKVDALREKLLEDQPDLDVVAIRAKGDAVLLDPRVARCDVLLLATGDQSAEIELASSWGGRIGVVHTWVEPLGLGGHVLAQRTGSRGCLACLFQMDDENGPFNVASFAAPGQRFSRTHAGCGGAFTPFSVLDADRSAAEAARALLQMVEAPSGGSFIWSWRGSAERFENAGYRLSRRGAQIRAGTTIEEDSGRFEAPDCRLCAGGIPHAS